jgi:hypothetical protein
VTSRARRRLVAAIAATAGVLVLGACSSGSGADPATTRTIVQTSTAPAPAVSFTPAPATSVAALPPSGKAPKGEVFRTCPYIEAGLDSEPTTAPNVADLEGDRVGRVTVLTGFTPVGCRFYFSYSYGDTRHQAVADIQPFTLATSAAARNAMIRTAEAGSSPETEQNFVPGLIGIRYQTRFFGPDGAKDWAFVFAKGRRMVVVHTQQTSSSLNAQQLAAAVAAKF